MAKSKVYFLTKIQDGHIVMARAVKNLYLQAKSGTVPNLHQNPRDGGLSRFKTAPTEDQQI